METPVFVWIIVAGFVLAIIYSRLKKKSYRRDYSLGMLEAQQAQQLIKDNKFDEVEALVGKQSINDITQIVDHLALSLEEAELKPWMETKNSDLSRLVLGVYYLHMAWITRSHKSANQVSAKRAQGFFEYLELSDEQFYQIAAESFYYPELCSRYIRLYMSLSEHPQAVAFFDHVTREYPDLLWPYLHRAEMIQPKWGGDLESLQEFYDALPDDFLIRSIVSLKLISDSMVQDDNYFNDRTSDIRQYGLEQVTAIDKQLESRSLDTIHKYVLYNYMEAVCGTLKQKELRKKYVSLVNGNYTIYPYGLV